MSTFLPLWSPQHSKVDALHRPMHRLVVVLRRQRGEHGAHLLVPVRRALPIFHQAIFSAVPARFGGGSSFMRSSLPQPPHLPTHDIFSSVIAGRGGRTRGVVGVRARR